MLGTFSERLISLFGRYQRALASTLPNTRKDTAVKIPAKIVFTLFLIALLVRLWRGLFNTTSLKITQGKQNPFLLYAILFLRARYRDPREAITPEAKRRAIFEDALPPIPVVGNPGVVPGSGVAVSVPLHG